LLTIMINILPVTSYADLIDPTKPPDLSQTGNLVLSAIMISPEHRLAVINGKILHEGDMINGLKVISITPNTVDLASSQEKLTLVLLTSPVKSVNY
jgi:Type II secretion system protein B